MGTRKTSDGKAPKARKLSINKKTLRDLTPKKDSKGGVRMGTTVFPETVGCDPSIICIRTR